MTSLCSMKRESNLIFSFPLACLIVPNDDNSQLTQVLQLLIIRFAYCSRVLQLVN